MGKVNFGVAAGSSPVVQVQWAEGSGWLCLC